LFNVGPTELLVVLIIALLVFGPKRLPEVGRTIGKSLREFRRATDEIKDEFRFDLDSADEPSPPPGTPSVVDGSYESASPPHQKDAEDEAGSTAAGGA
jgi:TatA/E family protein of Tat protein translocase